ncbi:MAG: efflux transporter periplasmic adaptor subunit [SAR86 cluster bacterium]|uniref:Efflux transporter periplasmic adaptor subunit n=1 Tax=SAR86 cluster bacterium TaxID=2030880 RepID=A0A2A5AH50_9GAMM|nr:MAG: efflux transporter periplasmic adaptor subunit [SAR86 cluster bacterium]
MKISDTSSQDVVLEPKSNKKRILVAAALLVTVAIVAWLAAPTVNRWSQAQMSVSAERLRFAEVSLGDFVRDISVQGKVIAAVSPTLYATQSGTITFEVESGDTVTTGQALASIDSPEIQNQLLQEQAQLSSLNVELQRQGITTRQQKLQNQKAEDSAAIALRAAQREMSRAAQAFEQGAMTEVDYEKAQDDLLTAELLHKHSLLDTALDSERLEFEIQTQLLSVEQQELRVADLRRQVQELVINSPVNGIVGNLSVGQKTNVAKNQPVLSVVDLSAFEVEIQVSESYADDLAIGMQAQIRAGSNTYEATLTAVSPEIINNQVTGRVRFNGKVPEGLRQNQRLTTRILLEEKFDVLMVQRGQFFDSGNGRFAYVVDDGIARRQPISVGATSLSRIEILSGLSAGETIVISSTELFNSADAVLINN